MPQGIAVVCGFWLLILAGFVTANTAEAQCVDCPQAPGATVMPVTPPITDPADFPPPLTSPYPAPPDALDALNAACASLTPEQLARATCCFVPLGTPCQWQ
jgi:hypothetical protein